MLLRRWIFEFRIELIQNGGGIVNIFISVSPLDRPRSALSLPISHEYITNAYQRFYECCQRLRALYQRYQCLRKSRRMTVFATFAEINKPVCKLSDRREEVGNNLWTFRICYRRHGESCEVWAIVKYVLPIAYSLVYSPCESSIKWPIFVRRWRMTCERGEFVANVAKFERLLNISVRKHIR